MLDFDRYHINMPGLINLSHNINLTGDGNEVIMLKIGSESESASLNVHDTNCESKVSNAGKFKDYFSC